MQRTVLYLQLIFDYKILTAMNLCAALDSDTDLALFDVKLLFVPLPVFFCMLLLLLLVFCCWSLFCRSNRAQLPITFFLFSSSLCRFRRQEKNFSLVFISPRNWANQIIHVTCCLNANSRSVHYPDVHSEVVICKIDWPQTEKNNQITLMSD